MIRPADADDWQATVVRSYPDEPKRAAPANVGFDGALERHVRRM